MAYFRGRREFRSNELTNTVGLTRETCDITRSNME